MEELRAALIGFGLAGSVFHAPLIAATPGLRLATIVTANPERAGRARREYPDVGVAPSTEALWKRPEEHDFVVVATPNASHAEIARCALDAGLPVVVDKPLAPTAAAARELVSLADRRRVALSVFHNRRWDSDHLTVRRLLEEGVLGEVWRVESRFERWCPGLRPGAWRDDATPAEGGGVLLDLGTHLVDQALTLFGPASHVHGEVAHRREGAADDDAFVALEHAAGIRSHLWASLVSAAPGPRLRVLGSEAAYVIDGVDGQEEALRAGSRPDSPGGWGEEPRERWGRIVRGEKSEPARSEPGAWPRYYARWRDALADRGPLPVEPNDAVAVLEVLERARGG